MEEEKWCIVASADPCYELSNTGKVRNTRTGKLLKLARNGTYHLRHNNRTRPQMVTTLMHRYWGINIQLTGELIDQIRISSGHEPFGDRRDIAHRTFDHSYQADNEYVVTIKCTISQKQNVKVVETQLREMLEDLDVDMDIEHKTTVIRKVKTVDIPNEEWKWMTRYPGYQISNCGRIRDMKGTTLTPSMSTNTCTYGLKLDGKVKRITVARLMDTYWPDHRIVFFNKAWCKYIKTINDQPSSNSTLRAI
jgi:hypothetical protein